MDASQFLQQLANGIILGAIYALVAIGLTMIYGVLKILHVAHASVYVLGAYLGFFALGLTGSFPLALVGAMLGCGVFGLLIERCLYRRMLTAPRIVPLIASIGLLIAMSDLIRLVAGPMPHPMLVDLPFAVDLGVVRLSGIHILIFGTVAVVVGLLWFLLHKTKIGLAIRAIPQNLESTRLMGIDANRAVQTVFFIGSAMAGIAGVLIAVYYNRLDPAMGDLLAYKALAIITIGGFGSVLGTIVGGMLLGVVETMVLTYFNLPLSREGLALLFMILLVVFRPYGLLGRA